MEEDHQQENLQPQEDSIECVENKLRELREQISQMEKENAELFEQLGLSPHQLDDILSDSSRYSQAAFEYIQRERLALEALLDRRIEEVNAPLKKQRSDTKKPVSGHWIFVR